MENIQIPDYFKSLSGDILNEVKTLLKEEDHEAGKNIFIEGDK